jgi:UDPglucose 6-dehydrogenase
LNRRQVPRLAEIIRSRLPKGGTVGVLGLSYKPDTEVIDESQGLDLAKYLASTGVHVVVYDPAALENARRQLGDAATYAASAADCARQADVLVITTAWPEFKRLTPADLKSGDRRLLAHLTGGSVRESDGLPETGVRGRRHQRRRGRF